MKKEYKEVNQEEFFKFIKEYPRKIDFNVTGICEPPQASYNDFSLGKYPESIIAYYFVDGINKGHGFNIIDEDDKK